MTNLGWAQVGAFRMCRQQLHERGPAAAMLEIAARICGLHAQLLSSAELSLWARVEGLPRDAVRRALWEERSLVKTWAMRGTLHLLPASEYPLWQAALSLFRHYLKPGWLRAFGMTARDHERLALAIGEALDGRVLSRLQLAEEVYRGTRSKKLRALVLQSWGSMLKPSAYQGRLCFGPSEGQNVRFARPDRWLRCGGVEDPEEASRAIARRFLAAHGPATREDYGRWWGLQTAPAELLLQGAGAAMVEVEGAPMWMLPEDVADAAGARPPRAVRLLPAFDPFVISASRHAERLMPGPFRARVYRSQGWISPVLLVAGRIEGVWRHERSGKRLRVVIEPFARLPSWARRAAEDEAERLAAFLGTAAETTFT